MFPNHSRKDIVYFAIVTECGDDGGFCIKGKTMEGLLVYFTVLSVELCMRRISGRYSSFLRFILVLFIALDASSIEFVLFMGVEVGEWYTGWGVEKN